MTTVAARIERERIPNARVMEAEAALALSSWFAPATVSRFYVFFPDPWWKRRHHKRRLLSPSFAALLADRLAPRGLLYFQTDVAEYARDALAVLEGTPGLRNAAGPGAVVPWEEELPHSPRERRYRRDGVPYHQIKLERVR